MAPTRQKKRKSTESISSVDVQRFPAPPQLVPTKTRSPVTTPMNRSPIRKPTIGITAGQKQALIDNLQLESKSFGVLSIGHVELQVTNLSIVTERARKLRAQYMLQAQGLRTRIEIRVNRIPMALRKANMGELLLKHNDNSFKSAPIARLSPAKSQSPVKTFQQREQIRASPSPNRPSKRLRYGSWLSTFKFPNNTSDEMAIDKENEDIENPKKRLRGPPQPPARTTSRANLKPSQVLSPRSANSRSHPQPTTHPTTSPGKSMLARPVSPLKPSPPIPTGGPSSILTNMVAKAKTTRGTAATRKATEASTAGNIGRGKRAAAPAPPPKTGRGRAESDSSNASGSTVVRKAPVPAAKKAAPAVKRTVMSTIKGMGSNATTKKASTAKTVAAPTGGRILRKRN